MSLPGQYSYSRPAAEQSAALETTETSLEEQKLLNQRLEKEQKDHKELHEAMASAEKELIAYAEKNNIDIHGSTCWKDAFGREKCTPAGTNMREGAATTPEFKRLLSEYNQKFESHAENDKRLAKLEKQIVTERERSEKSLKHARKITEKKAKAEEHQAEAETKKQEAEAERAKIELKKLKRDQPGFFERQRILKARKDRERAEALNAKREEIVAERELREVKEQEKKEKRLRKEQKRLTREENRRMRDVQVRKHKRRQSRKKGSRSRLSGWRL